MRWILRIVITWAILIAAGYFLGLPYAATLLQAKTRTQTLDQCQQQLAAQHLTGGANAPVKPSQAEHFCHCLADPLTVTRDDLLEVIDNYRKTGQKVPPQRIAAQVTTQVNACNPVLQQAILQNQPHAQVPAPVAPATPY